MIMKESECYYCGRTECLVDCPTWEFRNERPQLMEIDFEEEDLKPLWNPGFVEIDWEDEFGNGD